MGFLNKLTNNTTVNTFEQCLNRSGREIFSWTFRKLVCIPLEYTRLLLEVRKASHAGKNKKIPNNTLPSDIHKTS